MATSLGANGVRSSGHGFANSLVMPSYRGCHDVRDGLPIELSELFAGRGVSDVGACFGGLGGVGDCCGHGGTSPPGSAVAAGADAGVTP